jgi:hypothetical protein
MRIISMFSSAWGAPVLLVLATGICAGQTQNLSGNWHLNVEKSHWSSATKPVSVVLVIDHHEPQLKYTGTVTYANEDERSFGFDGAFDGKPYRMSRSFGEGSITLHRVDAWTVESSFRSDDGQFTETAHTTISRDGKTLTRKLTARSPGGNTSWTEIYEKR